MLPYKGHIMSSEKQKEYNKAYYLANREKLKAAHAEYRRTNWDTINSHRQLMRDKWFKELSAKRQARIEARATNLKKNPASLGKSTITKHPSPEFKA